MLLRYEAGNVSFRPTRACVAMKPWLVTDLWVFS